MATNTFSKPGLAINQLPPVTTADNDKVLTVDGGVWKAKEASGGSSLPSVTSDDNGDVLTVVSGAWAKAAPSGGGGGLVVHVTLDETGPLTVMLLDKTWKEISDVYSAGGSVVIEQSGGGATVQFGVVQCGVMGGTYAVSSLTINGNVQNYTTNSETGYPQHVVQMG